MLRPLLLLTKTPKTHHKARQWYLMLSSHMPVWPVGGTSRANLLHRLKKKELKLLGEQRWLKKGILDRKWLPAGCNRLDPLRSPENWLPGLIFSLSDFSRPVCGQESIQLSASPGRLAASPGTSGNPGSWRKKCFLFSAKDCCCLAYLNLNWIIKINKC